MDIKSLLKLFSFSMNLILFNHIQNFNKMICKWIIKLFILIKLNINFPIFACKTLIQIQNVKLPEDLYKSISIPGFILFKYRRKECFDSFEGGVLFHIKRRELKNKNNILISIKILIKIKINIIYFIYCLNICF